MANKPAGTQSASFFGSGWTQDIIGRTQYPYECKHSAPVCGSPECGSGWSQFDPVKGSLRNHGGSPYSPARVKKCPTCKGSGLVEVE